MEYKFICVRETKFTREKKIIKVAWCLWALYENNDYVSLLILLLNVAQLNHYGSYSAKHLHPVRNSGGLWFLASMEAWYACLIEQNIGHL